MLDLSPSIRKKHLKEKPFQSNHLDPPPPITRLLRDKLCGGVTRSVCPYLLSREHPWTGSCRARSPPGTCRSRREPPACSRWLGREGRWGCRCPSPGNTTINTSQPSSCQGHPGPLFVSNVPVLRSAGWSWVFAGIDIELCGYIVVQHGGSHKLHLHTNSWLAT